MNNNWKLTKILKIKITEMELFFSETESEKKKLSPIFKEGRHLHHNKRDRLLSMVSS